MDTIVIVQHSHFDAEVFKTRDEYLLWGYANLMDALTMLEQHADYRYVLEQVCLIQPFLETYPELKPKFLTYIQEGRLDIVCGMFTMADINMISGESLIRQILLGKRYCREELGVDVKIGWMIDTFGLHCQTPQIMAKAGFDAMVFDRVFPYDVSEFKWKGLDGTELVCHWPPLHYASYWDYPEDERGYKGFAEDVYQNIRKYAQTDMLLAFEGADLNAPRTNTLAMVERFNSDPNRKFNLVIETATYFFDKIMKHEKDLPVLQADMNPIFQGTYSARIAGKLWNRRLENLLTATETVNALAGQLGSADLQPGLETAWEPVLFNQFHDVLAGCHVDKVYFNMIDRFKQAKFIADDIQRRQMQYLLSRIDTMSQDMPVVVFNSLGWNRHDVAEVQLAFETDDVFDVSIVNSQGAEAPYQLDEIRRHGNGAIKQAKMLFMADVPSLGYETYSVRRNVAGSVQTGVGSTDTNEWQDVFTAYIENEFFKLEANLWTGAVTSLRLKDTGDEFVRDGCEFFGAVIKEKDEGDFWEINGPLRGGSVRPILRLYPLPDPACALYSTQHGGHGTAHHGKVKSVYHFNHTSTVLRFDTWVTMYAGMKRIDIKTTLHNKEKKVRYRTVFPTSIKQGTITHEIPFGAIERPEGEFPAYTWIDYADGNKGLGLVNCGMPGNAVIDGTLFLSLMRCVTYVSYAGGGYDPNTSAETGNEIGQEYAFEYSLVPHAGNWKQAELYRIGQERNHPLQTYKCMPHAGTLPKSQQFVALSESNLLISSVRQQGGNLVIRLYEAAGKETKAILSTALPVTALYSVNLMEDAGSYQPLPVHGQGYMFNVKPFEILTLVCKL